MIYFAHNRTTDLIKIGYSANVVQRVQSLRAKKNDVVLLGCILGDRHREKQMHEWFFRYHAQGEWFENSQEIRDFIEQNKILPRLVVSEHSWITFKDDYHGSSVPRDMLNRLMALAVERRTSFSKLAIELLERGIVAEEEALDVRDKKAGRK